MDREAIRTEMRDILGELVADFWTDAELNRYIQEALYRFSNEERWTFYMTEGTGQLDAASSDFELTAGVADSRHINITLTVSGQTRTFQPRRVSSAEGFRMRTAYTTSFTTTYPEFFYTSAVLNDEGEATYFVRFLPTPTSICDIDFQYYRDPAALDADADVPDLPVKYHKALVHHAAGTAWLKEVDGQQKASEQFGMYNQVLDQARTEWSKEPDDTPLVMGREEPQMGSRAVDSDYWLARMPETLTGP